MYARVFEFLRNVDDKPQIMLYKRSFCTFRLVCKQQKDFLFFVG